MATCIVKTGNSAGVNVRASKDTGSTRLGVIDNGVSVDVVRCNDTWATLMYNSTPAFVQHKYLQNPPSTNGDGLSVNANATCNGNSVNVRNAANGSTVVKQINKGVSYTVLGKSLTGGYYWYQIGTNQWVRGDYLTPNSSGSSGGGNTGTGVDDYPIRATIDTVKHGVGGTVKLRAAESKNSDVVTNIPDRSTIYVKSLSGAWLAAKYNSYTGYIMAEFVVGSDVYNGSTGGSTGGGTGVNTATWAQVLAGNGVYKKESSSSAVCEGVKTLQQYLKNIGYGSNNVGEITVDGNFGSVTEMAVKYFQTECGLQADGVVGSATANKLAQVQNDSIFTDTNYYPLKSNLFTYDNYPYNEVSLVARIICAEHGYAGNEHSDGRAGVAKVLKNRKDKGGVTLYNSNKPRDYKNVIFGKGQYTTATSAMAYRVARGTTAFEEAVSYARTVCAGNTPSGAAKVTNQLFQKGSRADSTTYQAKPDYCRYPATGSNYSFFYNEN